MEEAKARSKIRRSPIVADAASAGYGRDCLRPIDLELKFVVRGIDLCPPARNSFGLFEDHRDTAVRHARSIFATLKDRGDLRIEPLCDAVSNSSRTRRDEALRSTRIDEFDRAVVDKNTRGDITQYEIAVYKRVRHCFADRVNMVPCSRAHG